MGRLPGEPCSQELGAWLLSRTGTTRTSLRRRPQPPRRQGPAAASRWRPRSACAGPCRAGPAPLRSAHRQPGKKSARRGGAAAGSASFTCCSPRDALNAALWRPPLRSSPPLLPSPSLLVVAVGRGRGGGGGEVLARKRGKGPSRQCGTASRLGEKQDLAKASEPGFPRHSLGTHVRG